MQKVLVWLLNGIDLEGWRVDRVETADEWS